MVKVDILLKMCGTKVQKLLTIHYEAVGLASRDIVLPQPRRNITTTWRRTPTMFSSVHTGNGDITYMIIFKHGFRFNSPNKFLLLPIFFLLNYFELEY